WHFDQLLLLSVTPMTPYSFLSVRMQPRNTASDIELASRSAPVTPPARPREPDPGLLANLRRRAGQMIPRAPRITLPTARTNPALAGALSMLGISSGGTLYLAGVIGAVNERIPVMMAGVAITTAGMSLYHHAFLKLRPLEVPAQAHEAMNALTVEFDEPEQAALMQEVGRNRMNIIDHIQDLVTGSDTHPAVREAASRAGDDPQQIIRNLLALVTQNPPILSNRPTSSPQPADVRPRDPHDMV
ncbi:MAG TPA: hypothetical protein VFP68_05120, partial [Burkholderiaceae bacterium]|nr:hypothetical protein [Burkholderiaceae bacterium]